MYAQLFIQKRKAQMVVFYFCDKFITHNLSIEVLLNFCYTADSEVQTTSKDNWNCSQGKMEKTMSDTKYKLNEAKYFLGQMHSNIDNHEVFQYLLSACISALRSVTLFMQEEYTHTPNFSDWYKSKQAQMEADPMFSFFNKQRVIT